jgi:hypothetical protein
MEEDIRTKNKRLLEKFIERRVAADSSFRSGFISGALTMIEFVKWGKLNLETLEIIDDHD